MADTEPAKPDPVADRSAAILVLQADADRRRQRFAELVKMAETETGCEFVAAVVTWVEAGVIRVAPRVDIHDRGAPGG